MEHNINKRPKKPNYNHTLFDTILKAKTADYNKVYRHKMKATIYLLKIYYSNVECNREMRVVKRYVFQLKKRKLTSLYIT